VGDVGVDRIFSFIGGVDVVVAELELWLDFMFRLDESLRLTPGFLYRPKSPDISDISFLSIGADKKISIFFVQILFKFI